MKTLVMTAMALGVIFTLGSNQVEAWPYYGGPGFYNGAPAPYYYNDYGWGPGYGYYYGHRPLVSVGPIGIL